MDLINTLSLLKAIRNNKHEAQLTIAIIDKAYKEEQIDFSLAKYVLEGCTSLDQIRITAHNLLLG